MSDLQKELKNTFDNLNQTLQTVVNFIGSRDEAIKALAVEVDKQNQTQIKKNSDEVIEKFKAVNISTLKEGFGLANNYSKVIVGGFYAGFLALLLGTKDVIDPVFLKKAAILFLLSLSVYALEVVLYSALGQHHYFKSLEAAMKGGATLEESDQLHRAHVEYLIKLKPLNFGAFIFTVITAFGAIAFLLQGLS